MTTPLSSVPDRVLSPTRSAAAEARRQRREQLRDFYGLSKGSTPGTGTGTAPSTASASASAAGTPPASALASPDLGAVQATQFATLAIPQSPGHGAGGSGFTPITPAATLLTPRETRDFSSPHFVPAEYYEDLIARATLGELLRTTSTLASDVGRLQSSRHTLVYNHHHQLFSAGDTIAQLNTRTPQLLSIVTSLQERFSDMSQLTDSVALPDIAEREGHDEGVLARAGTRLERVRLMVLADEPKEKILETWHKTESSLLNATSTPALEALLREGRQLAEVQR